MRMVQVEVTGDCPIQHKFRLGPRVTLEPGTRVLLEPYQANYFCRHWPTKVGRVEALAAKRAEPHNLKGPLNWQPGDAITWCSAGAERTGVIDCIHVDPEGVWWAYVTSKAGWAFVNLKYAKVAA